MVKGRRLELPQVSGWVLRELGAPRVHVATSIPGPPKRRPPATTRFFRLFPELDGAEVLCYGARQEYYEALDSQLAPIGGGLRGQLTPPDPGRRRYWKI